MLKFNMKKKKSALRIPRYFWEHFQDLFVVPYHRLFFKVIQNLFYPHPNQPTNQPTKKTPTENHPNIYVV